MASNKQGALLQVPKDYETPKIISIQLIRNPGQASYLIEKRDEEGRFFSLQKGREGLEDFEMHD